MEDPGPLLDLAVALARQAGELLAEGERRARVDVSTKSSRTDMVTEMDRAAEALIVEGLRRVRPDDAVLGEEGTARPGTTGVRWIVDPLDGTTNYLYRHPAFAVSIAIEVDGDVVAGVIADPSHAEVFTATRGDGARRNGEPVHATDGDELSTALIATGFAYLPERRARQAAVLTRVLPAVRDIRRNGAASLDLCWVACGRLDGFYEKGLQPWDVAAGALVAEEAGAVVGDLAGGPASGDFAFAAAPGIADALARLLISAGARDA